MEELLVLAILLYEEMIAIDIFMEKRYYCNEQKFIQTTKRRDYAEIKGTVSGNPRRNTF